MRLLNCFHLCSLIILVIFSGCGKSSNTDNSEGTDSTALIRITKAQFESDSMKIGEVTLQTFQEEVKCAGYIMAPVNGIAQVNAPIAGIVGSIKCAVGDYVKKGQVVCMMSSLDLIMVQQDYFEAVTRLSTLKSEYERSKALYREKIGSEKDFLTAESEYKSAQAKCQALNLYLKQLNLDAAEIENGKMFSEFTVTSPINGFITRHNIILGQFTEQQIFLFEVVDETQLQVYLHLFEKDVNKLKAGQSVLFDRAGNATINNRATLISIGKTIDPESRTILCVASIDKVENTLNFIHRTFIEARIIVDQSEALALPSDAILKDGKDQVVLVLERSEGPAIYLHKEKIQTGRTFNGFTEVLHPIIKGRVLVEGVYNIRVE